MQSVHGIIIEGDEACLLAALVRVAVRHLERIDGAAPAAALGLRERLDAFDDAIRAGTLTSGTSGQHCAAASGFPDIDLAVPGSLAVRDVAQLAGISHQAVTARCRSGSLDAVRTRGRWEIDAGSAAALAASRKRT